MDRRASSAPIHFARHRHLEKRDLQSNLEYYGNPSQMALQTFNHVMEIGKTRCKQHQMWRRADNRIGYLIHFVNRGEYWHRINGREFRVGEGGLCLLDCSKRFEQGNDRPRTTDLWWIGFHGREAPRIVAQLGVDRHPVFDHVPRRRFQSLFRQLWAVLARKPIAYEARAHAILAAILAELFVARVRQRDIMRAMGREAKLSERVQIAIECMTRFGQDRIGLKEIAGRVGLSLHYFARKFRREVGMAPIQYLNGFRIEQAKRLLTSTEKSVGEIGRLVGVPDPGYFCRLFRKLAGDTPESYRKKQRHS